MKAALVLLGAVMAFSFSVNAKPKGKINPDKAKLAALKVWSLVDYTDHSRSLDKAKIVRMNLAFVKKYHPEFYLFVKGYDKAEKMCFEGPANEAAEIIEAILNVATGDAYVYPKTARVTDVQITQHVKYEDEGGYHDFDIKVNRCK